MNLRILKVIIFLCLFFGMYRPECPLALEDGKTVISSAEVIDYGSERSIGESLALEAFRRYGMPVNDMDLQKYLNLVGTALARNSRRPGIPYRFVAIKSPLQTAFSCPGGIIFLSSGLLKTIQTEAQLACVVSHEIAHVGHRHALQSIWKTWSFQVDGKEKQFRAMIEDLQSILFDRGLDKDMEFEADLTGMEIAYSTGYGPNGMIEVLRQLKKIETKSKKKGSWFSTHPPLNQRIEKCQNQLRRYRGWRGLAQLPDRYYLYKKRIP